MYTKEIIIDPGLAKKLKLDPLDVKTMQIESKLLSLEIGPDGKIQGARPIKSGGNNTLPPNSAFIKIEGIPLIISPIGTDIIFIADKVTG